MFGLFLFSILAWPLFTGGLFIFARHRELQIIKKINNTHLKNDDDIQLQNLSTGRI